MPILGIMASSVQSAVGDFESIATVNGTGSSATITFSSIPSTYKHLQIRAFIKGTSVLGGFITLCTIATNSDTTATNYYTHYLSGDGGVSTGNSNSNTTYMLASTGSITSANGAYSAHVVDVLDYTDTNKQKTIRGFGGVDTNGNGGIYLASVLWKNTNTITSITISNSDSTYFGSFTTGSTIALYGIK
jgi:hypothetical protein